MVQSVKNKITFVCGKTRSGKSFLTEKLAQVMGYTFIEISSIVKQLLGSSLRSDIVEKPEIDSQIIELLQARLAKDNLLVSGVRQLSIIKRFPDAQVIWLHTPDHVRQLWFEQDLLCRGDDMKLSQIDESDKKLGLPLIANYILSEDV